MSVEESSSDQNSPLIRETSGMACSVISNHEFKAENLEQDDASSDSKPTVSRGECDAPVSEALNETYASDNSDISRPLSVVSDEKDDVTGEVSPKRVLDLPSNELIFSPKKRGLIIDKEDGKCFVENDTNSGNLKSTTDFLQKLVEEQKSQVPNLFCRDLYDRGVVSSKAYTSAKSSKIYNVPNNEIVQPNKEDSVESSPRAKLSPVLSSDCKNFVNVDRETSPVNSDAIPSRRVTATFLEKFDQPSTSSSIVQQESSGRLRFFLDGRFVLELTHAGDNTRNTSGWVQSKGKIWTPSSKATVGSTNVQVADPRPVVEERSRVPLHKPVNLSVSQSVGTNNTPFMLNIPRPVRIFYMCWLSVKELRRGARNLAVNLGLLYQKAQAKNSCLKRPLHYSGVVKRKNGKHTRILKGFWKDVFTRSTEFRKETSTEDTKPGHCDSNDSCSNRSLLLDALTKPKLRDETSGSETINVKSPLRFSLSVSSRTDSHVNHSTVHGKLGFQVSSTKSSLAMKLTRTSDDESCASTLKANSSNSSASSSNLPLPEWYLDPSKAEVPVSEMIGYPRPYLPPSTDSTTSSIRKRHKVVGLSSPPDSLTNYSYVKNEISSKDSSSQSDSGLKFGKGFIQDGQKLQITSRQCDSPVEEHPSKSPLNKRFGNYRRGHAVNEAVRTFVISDIVNLGGEVKTRYVPRGVHAEVASRYKIDVSVTTKWWLRYCAEQEQLALHSSSDTPTRETESGLVRSVKNESEELTKTTYSSNVTRQVPWIPSMSSKSTTIATGSMVSFSRPVCKSPWAAINKSTREPFRPVDISLKRCSPAEDVTRTWNEAPMDLRVEAKRKKDEPLPLIKSPRLGTTEMEPSISENHKTIPNEPYSRYPPFSSNLLESNPTNPVVLPSGSETSYSVRSSSSRSDLHSSSLVNSRCDEFPMLSSALKSHDSDSMDRMLQIGASDNVSRDPAYRLTDTGAPKSEGAADFSGSSKGLPVDYSHQRVPHIPSLPGEYPHMAGPPPHPPSIGLAPWPYPPCPVVAYGPALVNSYYYCCCFLPGCRFHYMYNTEGRPVIAGDHVGHPPGMMGDSYKYCSRPGVQPGVFDPARREEMYKSWVNPDAESTPSGSTAAPSTCKREDVPSPQHNTVEEETVDDNSATSGSMLKDLLLKPSRTPERSAILSKELETGESVLKTEKNFLPGVKEELPLTPSEVKNYDDDDDGISVTSLGEASEAERSVTTFSKTEPVDFSKTEAVVVREPLNGESERADEVASKSETGIDLSTGPSRSFWINGPLSTSTPCQSRSGI